MKVLLAILFIAGLGTWLWWSSDARTRFEPSALNRISSSTLTLHCADSTGHQGKDGETVVGGVEGLILPGSRDPSALSPVRGADGRHYFVYKAFLAVSSAVAPYATVSIVRPTSAKLFYGSATEVGDLSSNHHGRALVAASKRQVRLAVCGPNFTGYVGGIIVAKPTSVTFAVSSPHRMIKRVTISIGTD